MKNIFKGLLIGAAVVAMTSCVEESLVQYDPENAVAPVLNELPSSSYELSEDGDDITFTWFQADFGVAAAVRYTLYASCEGYADKSVDYVDGVESTSITVAAATLNNVLISSFECEAYSPYDISFYVVAAIKSTSGLTDAALTSNVISATITPYPAEVKYDCVYVTGALNGWVFTGPFLYNYENDGVNYQGVVDFTEDYASNEFKITDSPDWNNGNYGASDTTEGGDPDSYQFVDGSNDNVKVYRDHRYYHFTFDKGALVIYKDYGFDAATVNVNGTDYEMTYNLGKQRFYVDVDGASGTVIASLDGAQFATADLTSSGDQRIYFDFNDLNNVSLFGSASAYGTDEDEGSDSGEETGNKQWELAGAFSDWGYIDMKENNGVYIAYGVEASAGDEYGFHDLDDSWWAVPKDDGNLEDGKYQPTIGAAFTIEHNDGNTVNIVIPADGTYDIYVNPSYNISYLMNAGEVPGAVNNTWGICGTVNGWGATGDFALTQDEDNTDLWYIKGLPLANEDQIKLRYNNAADWSEGDFGLADGAEYHANTAIALKAGGGNITVTRTGTYDVYFYNTSGSETLYVMDAGYAPGESVPTWGIVGSVNNQGWDTSTAFEMEHIEGYYVYYSLPLAGGDEFKFLWNHDSWTSDEYNYGGTFSEVGVAFRVSNGGSNITTPSDFTSGNYDIYLDVDNGLAYIMYEGDVPSGELVEDYWEVIGSFTDSWGSSIKMEQGSDGLWYTTGVEMTTSDEFKFRKDGDWSIGDFGASEFAVNTAVTLTPGGANIVPTQNGTYDIYLDADNGIAYFMEEGKNPDVGTWYYTGSLPGCNSWGTFIEMSHVDGYWVSTGITFSVGDEFKFLRDNAWDINRGGAFAVDAAFDVYQNGDNIISTVAGTYDLYLDAVNDKAYVLTSGKTPADVN